jgi:uncharacterized protein YidB (DUF937 family)
MSFWTSHDVVLNDGGMVPPPCDLQRRCNMGLLDDVTSTLRGALGEAGAAAAPTLIAAVLGKTNLGDLSGLVNQLQQGGLGDQVRSWLGNGANLPVTPDQIRSALGDQHVRQLAEQFGVPVDEALKFLADHVPTTVDQASPDGQIK